MKSKIKYIAERKTFAPNVKKSGFFWEMLKVQPRGTSRICYVLVISTR